ncbi:adenine deaminase [Brevibacillus sp. CF112]|nr:adenine deaminase [Brevibacillus sp. CF112]
MASYNTAKAYHMDDQIGSLTPGRFADIVSTDSLSQINPLYVFKDGELIAKDLSVIRRYADGKRHVVNGLFKGVYVEHGAVATSWPAPLPYFVVVGQDSAEMCYCAKEVDKYSGACIVTDNQTNKSVLPLEIYGVMANMTASELTKSADAIDVALEELGNRNEGEPVVNK